MNCLKKNFKIYIKINIKTAPTCFGTVTPSSLFVVAKATTNNDDGVTVPKHVGAVLMLILM